MRSWLMRPRPASATLGRMLVESVAADGSGAEGRCAHQGPEDATTTLRPTTAIDVSVGDVLDVRFIDSEGPT